MNSCLLITNPQQVEEQLFRVRNCFPTQNFNPLDHKQSAFHFDVRNANGKQYFSITTSKDEVIAKLKREPHGQTIDIPHNVVMILQPYANKVLRKEIYTIGRKVFTFYNGLQFLTIEGEAILLVDYPGIDISPFDLSDHDFAYLCYPLNTLMGKIELAIRYLGKQITKWWNQ